MYRIAVRVYHWSNPKGLNADTTLREGLEGPMVSAARSLRALPHRAR
jgi:hypothetical protein